MILRLFLFPVLAAMLAAAPALAAEACLTPQEARIVAATDKLIDGPDAVRAAHGAVKGEVVSVNLCRVDARMMYVLAILSSQGRVVRIGVDAKNRAVRELR